jgi:N-methylhydantoinase B
MDPVTLEVFKHLFASAAEAMGVTLGRTAYSPNIKERRDYSCAVFDGQGRLLAQAAHIPVHLGAMPASVRAALDECSPFAPGDVVILNDPYLGGTHLPDITLVSSVFIAGGDSADFYVASRAHHADVGGATPGSMPLANEIYQEGLIIPPLKLNEDGRRNEAVWRLILRNVRTPDERRGDLEAQLAAHAIGARRLEEIVAHYGLAETQTYAAELLAYAERLTRAAIAAIPDGTYTFEDYLEGDTPIPICVAITVQDDTMLVDFTGSAPAMEGPLNAVRAIVESAVAYVVRCIAGADVPANAGAFAPVRVVVPPGSILDPDPPHAVAGGNVETSQRIVDVLLGALAQALPERIPAASQGTMNNLAFGGIDPRTGKPFAYYETLGGGHGGGPEGDGIGGRHAHMSNTLNTPVEALEYALPIRIRHYSLRRASGGVGHHRGGDGLRRDIEFLTAAQITILSERRERGPYGLAGGGLGAPGQNVLVREGEETLLPGKTTLRLQPGDVLSIRTPGGGGFGQSPVTLQA